MVKIRFNRSTDATGWGLRLSWEHHIVVNWTILKKSILLLILAAFMSLFWISWDIFILMHPQYSEWVHLSIVRSHLWTSLITLLVMLLLIIPCHVFKDRAWAQNVLPILSVQIFTAMLCHKGYLVGSFSPATMVGYVSVVGVGLVLFDRRMVYCALIPATLALLFCNYLSMVGILTYAPLFNMQRLNEVSMHPFWVGSMVFFLLPILLACLFLFEILLTQWRTREMTIQILSRLDPLTNVLNRRSIGSYLERLHQQPNPLYSIVLLDLDHFKSINDHFGHSMGDQVLVTVAQCLAKNLRDQDIIGRFGGEEFILLLPNTTTAQAQNVAERCRLAVSKLRFINEQKQEFTVSASFGISSSLSADEPHLIISQADQALYAVKAAGRNQVKIFTELAMS
ncbi:GGDEF domain-containing protein [Acinetobacter sp. ANC 3882]|uniref:GGDEF domain-containing protein n=1 Tax=Acinetobacter sp. ANC 3882 TaxID=2923423 RepID=UPI001F4A5DEF|nr:GGDEF domain-containing protein [Acinetobacter sp. ANC 3882]MCH7313903.1 GGDEF domain-containing protein [Acinetobacter sp. ANC 3882]